MSPACHEEPLCFEVAGQRLLGLLSLPPSAPQRDTAVLIVVGGPQYRVGSHRQFVSLARRLASEGYPVLRFDQRGMGDSDGDPPGFEAIGADIGAAVDALSARLPATNQVVLWGLCDGASAALLYLNERADARVTGLCLLNPWVRSEVGLARTHVKHYYAQRLLQRDFWLKLLSGKVAARALAGLFDNLRLALRAPVSGEHTTRRYQDRMAGAWGRFGGPILLLLSGDDYTAKEFLEHVSVEPAWKDMLVQPRLQRIDLAGADHTCSATADTQRMEQATLDWLRLAFPGLALDDSLSYRAPIAAEGTLRR